MLGGTQENTAQSQTLIYFYPCEVCVLRWKQFDVVKRNNLSAIWCSVTFKSTFTIFQSFSLKNNLTKISCHKTNDSLKEHLFGFKEISFMSTIMTLWLNLTQSKMQKECTEIGKIFHKSMFSSVKMSWTKENETLVESVALVKNSCILFAKRQAAHTVHVTWIVVGLRTTGLCNRTMTSPSSFCTCLWSTPWAGGLISTKEKRKMRQRERERGRGGKMKRCPLFVAKFTQFFTTKLASSP